MWRRSSQPALFAPFPPAANTSCLGTLLRAAAREAWPACVRGFSLVLGHLTDPRPKVRKAAVAAAVGVLESLRGLPSAQLAGGAVAKASERALRAPVAAASSAVSTEVPAPSLPPSRRAPRLTLPP